IVVDDGSADNTIDILKALQLPNLKIVQASHGGKATALNAGLKQVSNDIVVCMDADTFLHPQALKRIVARFLTDPADTAAVAGCVLVKNSRSTFMTRLQEWDYFTGISSAKRQQSLYQGTLVAQGPFYAFFFLPVIILALFRSYYIVGPLTLLVVPIAFLIVIVMYKKQKAVFDTLNLKVRSNPIGFIVYMLVYQAVMSPICVIGYAQEI